MMTKIIEIDYKKTLGLISDLCRQITISDWKPDYIVGISRGGLMPAVYMSHYFNLPMHTLKVTLRHESEDTESNLWMAEEAFGYVEQRDRDEDVSWTDVNKRKNILIVDDINDTGATFNWIKNDWESGCMGTVATDIWQEIWATNVKFAVLVNNEASNFKEVTYAAKEINKHQEPSWVVFPWEEWWMR